MKDKILFECNRIKVTSRLFRVPRKTYRLSDIEKITLKRSLFIGSLPLSTGCAALIWEYGDYLYFPEIGVCGFMIFILPFITWRLGTLSVTSKSLRDDDAITGWMSTLVQARDAIENAIYIGHDHQFLEADDE